MGYHDNPPYFMTAYEIAVKWGFRGTEQEWLASLKAFYLASKAGFVGTEEEWTALLVDPVPEFQIGEVVTLEGGSKATASISGDKKHPVLNLGIPRGVGMADALPLVGGKMKGIIDMDGNTIMNLPAPLKKDQAVPKNYVDTRLKRDGTEAMEGNLDMGSFHVRNLREPTEKDHAVTKSYADERLKKDGSEAMEGDLDMGDYVIKNVAAPTEEGHAVNKKYADDLASSLHDRFTISLPASGWSEALPYTQTVTLEGILPSDDPHWDVVLSADTATAIAQKEAYALVDDLTTANGSIIFTCFEEKPEVDLTIHLEVNR